MTPIKIMLVDDDRWVRLSFRPMLESVSRLKVVAEANGAEEALQHLRSNPDIHVAIVDIQIHGAVNGIQLTEQIRNQFPHVAVLIFTNADREEYIREAKQAGAHDYLLKETDWREIVSIIEHLVDNPTGTVYPFEKLTPSERAVLWLIGDGQATKEIALVRGIASGGVSVHCKRIWQKLKIKKPLHSFERIKVAIQYRTNHNEPIEILGLATAINWHMFKIGLLTFLNSRAKGVSIPKKDNVDRVPTEAKTALFLVAHEVLNNVKQQAHGGHVSVKMKSDSKHVKLTLEYDGDGFNVAPIKRNMEEQVEAIGGELSITSPPPGTTITATIPHPQCDHKYEKDE